MTETPAAASTFPQGPDWRTAVVTGAASRRGIGRAAADRLARDGWSVAILDQDGEGARKAAEEISAARGVRVIGLGTDVADEGSVDAAITRVEADLPPVVALLNLAGVSSPVAFVDLTPAEWDRVMDVNLRGAFLVTRRVVPGMIERRLGRVVSVSSISAQRGGGTYSKVAYSAAKAGLIGFTRALARELGPYGITANCVAPGPVDTDIMGGELTPERKREMSVGMPVGRVGTPDEVAALMVYLAGPDAGWITAATYDINGGLQVS
jgi:NAD(P)-dependent dehydrogenase (short-subunit alcohol dehydrogenase family)